MLQLISTLQVWVSGLLWDLPQKGIPMVTTFELRMISVVRAGLSGFPATHHGLILDNINTKLR